MSESIALQVKEILSEIKPASEIPDDNLVEGAIIDSFDIIVLVDALEEKFRISLPGHKISPENFNSISALSKLVEEYLVDKS